jgi:transglutaminase-like putative cysteine protease
MTTRYEITHTTKYDYSTEVSVSHHIARLTPRRSDRQSIVLYGLTVVPEPISTSDHTDYFGNTVTFVEMFSPHTELTVTARSVVEVNMPDAPRKSPAWDIVRDGLGNDPLEPYEFSLDSPLIAATPALAGYADTSFPKGRPLMDAVTDLTGRIHRDFTFDRTATTVATPLDVVFRNRRGVCQDFAHLEIACLRSLGLAARYVSGYLESVPPPNQPRLAGADASHAWVSVYCPGSEWIDVDPTNNLIPANRHVALAWGRDYSDVSPIRGVILGGGDHRWRVAVDVIRSEQAGLAPHDKPLVGQ